MDLLGKPADIDGPGALVLLEGFPIRAAAVVFLLLGGDGLGHKDEWVRLRVAEVWGRMSAPVDGKALARAVDANSSWAPALWPLLKSIGVVEAETRTWRRLTRPALTRS